MSRQWARILRFIADIVASFGAMPFSIFAVTASTTTMASSTTMPIASTSPSNDSVLIEKPSMGKYHKGADQGYRHRQGRDQGRSHVLQEQEYHEDNQRHRLEQGGDDFVDALLDGERRIQRHEVVEVGGKIPFHLFHHRIDLLGDRQAIGPG